MKGVWDDLPFDSLDRGQKNARIIDKIRTNRPLTDEEQRYYDTHKSDIDQLMETFSDIYFDDQSKQ